MLSLQILLNNKIGVIFSGSSGYNLREIINLVDELRFRTNDEKQELSSLYEDKIKNMGNAGRNGGEHYEPRPLIKIIIKVLTLNLSKPFAAEKLGGVPQNKGFVYWISEVLYANSID